MRGLELAHHQLDKTKEALFEEVMQAYLKKVLRLVYLIVKDRSSAEDITQEVFLKAYKNLGSFREESSMQTWIYRIAVNEAKKHLRSWSFRKLFYKPDVDAGIVEDTASAVILSEHRIRFARHVMELSSSYRQLIVLHYYEELSVEEVADILGISTGAVYTKLHRARQKLKERLEKEGAW
ncbi:RNA polymerase subunit sigma [Brevibacillus reuszeri]|uniref:RNA polymerase sigma factor n=1 Tax=Brevibacillus reuszeri TaxID=54915 RepID=A0A0K9YTY6_9BACL|nr:sigma-70 family RNA polymerase sigma factor [Brevibacillus reuszeri]KNB72112.1 RNA polymerase [Brevibacillus reuszeri]MED1855385.1 sigma-70 family RNA polymerase sigma factor [Brevibacillus reuszeri]GED67466.1 RNA polymerase subunit sigma [Brevibacillus reuszeri]